MEHIKKLDQFASDESVGGVEFVLGVREKRDDKGKLLVPGITVTGPEGASIDRVAQQLWKTLGTVLNGHP